MKLYEIAFFAMATIMGIITAVGVFVLIKKVEADKRNSDAEDEATR
ncbi:MAG: hypothetical protein H6839_08105 [Planctomycetes bacterium]|nr:hypothetical protein [Planctomycetota bacterium]